MVRHRRPALGSSPLTRGARFTPGRDVHRFGLIPAHAGSTGPIRSERGPSWAHPRSRGEHVDGTGVLTAGTGSSPLTRGALQPRGREPAGVGLIPAHAGSTKKTETMLKHFGAHPRSRGEHATKLSHATW